MDSLKKYNFKDDHGHPLENCQDFIELVHRAESAESSLAAMRQRAEGAESCLRRVQRLADDGVDDPAGPYNVLAQIANTVEAALSSHPADASTTGGEAVSKMENSELLQKVRRLANALKGCLAKGNRWHPCDPVVVEANAALADMEQKS